MERRVRKVPSWLETTCDKKISEGAKLAFTSQPRTVFYVMSPKEVNEVSEAILNEEKLKLDQEGKSCQNS